MSKYCEKCKKNVPIIVVGNEEECMICGTRIIPGQAVKALKNLCETDQDSGKYKNAQRVGRNVAIGVFIIVLGLLYSFYGLQATIFIVIFLISIIFASSLIIYYLIRLKVI